MLVGGEAPPVGPDAWVQELATQLTQLVQQRVEAISSAASVRIVASPPAP